jgi:hypothetical protein
MAIFTIYKNGLASKSPSPKFKNNLKFFDMTKVIKSSPVSKRSGVKKEFKAFNYLYITYIRL